MKKASFVVFTVLAGEVLAVSPTVSTRGTPSQAVSSKGSRKNQVSTAGRSRESVKAPVATVPEAPKPDEKDGRLKEIKLHHSIAVEAAKTSCNGIYKQLHDIQALAGWNTGISGLGTLAAGGALGTGIAKSKKDAAIEVLDAKIAEIEKMSDQEFFNFLQQLAALKDQKDRAEDESKKLGNWRSGLMIGATGTSIASAVMAYQNFDMSPIVNSMNSCNKAIGGLKSVVAEMDASGLVKKSDYDYLVATDIVENCELYNVNQLHSVENQNKAVAISSTVGIGTGLVGSVTSLIANTNAVRYGEDGKKDYVAEDLKKMQDKEKVGAELESKGIAKPKKDKKLEKGLNLTANIAAGATTVTSGISTGFSIAQLATIGDLVNVSERCERTLNSF